MMPKILLAYALTIGAGASYFAQAIYAAIWSDPRLVIAQAPAAGPGESLFLTAVNYTGLGVVCLISLYMMREMSKDSRSQLKEMMELFNLSLKQERDQRETMGKTIEGRVVEDHNKCRVDHKELMDTLEEILRKMSECSVRRGG